MLTLDLRDRSLADPETTAQALCDATNGGIKDHADHLEVIHRTDGVWHSVLIPTAPKAEV